ncbi:hypothetical protein Lfu02_60790 [Longispora fulva]|uniref:HAMP domain-containing protein n=1 Tax=Longispora fulva TaxID=619741 RepID=A0A8J7GH88_9ACTN|nr:HAMP domain-containing protein [Longispora fulva]MBG6136940.1 hypothetical protein [Longispora fulva]GIG61707.1 hypothetical protein Lfu02_60790 [Longispora fulva]
MGSQEWRRICLDRQLPRPRLPAGVAVPSRVCALALVLVAVAGVVGLAGPAHPSVPGAVVEAQTRTTELVAGGIRTTAITGLQSLLAAAEGYAHNEAGRDPRHLAESVVGGRSTWRGSVVLDHGGTVQAYGGPVPVGSLAAGSTAAGVTSVRDAAGVHLVGFVPLADGRELVASTTLRPHLARVDAGQSLVLVPRVGGWAVAQGAAVSSDDPVLSPLVARAAADAAGRGAASVVGTAARAGAAPGPTGTAPGPGATAGAGPGPHATGGAGPAGAGGATAGGGSAVGTTVPVVSAVSTGDSGLTVVSVAHVALQPQGSPWSGLPLALSLCGVAVVCLVLGHIGIVAPLRRLRTHCSAAAIGDGGTHAPRWRTREVARIADSVRRLRRPGQPRPTRPALSTWLVAVLCAAAPIGWAVAAVAPDQGHEPPVPAQVAVDLQNQVDIVGRTVQQALDSGLAQVSTAAGAGAPGVGAGAAGAAGAGPAGAGAAGPGAAGAGASGAGAGSAGIRAQLDALAANGRFRSVYVVDATGRVTAGPAGREPLRPAGPVPPGSGVVVDERVTRVPALYAHARLAPGSDLVAEYDIRYLSALLGRADGRLRLVDERFRTWVDTEGYQAFGTVRNQRLRDAGTAAFAGRSSVGTVTVAGSRAVVTAVALDSESATRHLGLAVIAERRTGDLDLVERRERHRRLLVALAAVTVGLGGLGWHLFLVALPLRRLAGAAGRLADGDTRTPISLARQDEIGAIALCLDICRQVALYGPERLGGATRLRGAVGVPTMVLPIIPGPRGPDPVGATAPVPRARAVVPVPRAGAVVPAPRAASAAPVSRVGRR